MSTAPAPVVMKLSMLFFSTMYTLPKKVDMQEKIVEISSSGIYFQEL